MADHLFWTYCLCICKAGRQLGLEDLFLGTLHQLVAAVTPPNVDLTGLRHQGRIPCLYAVWADTGARVVWCHSTYLWKHFKDCINTKTCGRVLDSIHCSNCISSIWINLQWEGQKGSRTIYTIWKSKIGENTPRPDYQGWGLVYSCNLEVFDLIFFGDNFVSNLFQRNEQCPPTSQ